MKVINETCNRAITMTENWNPFATVVMEKGAVMHFLFWPRY